MILSLRETRTAWWQRFWPTYRQQVYTGAAVMTMTVLGLVGWLSQSHPEHWAAVVAALRPHAGVLSCALPLAIGLMALPITLAVTGPYPTWAQHKRLVAFARFYRAHQGQEDA